MNAGSRLASESPGQPRTSVLARRAAQRVREAAATFRRDDVPAANGRGGIERSHRFTIVSGRVDRESVKGTFGLSLSWRNAARRERSVPPDGPLAVMRLHLDLHVPRLGRDVSCHRAFFFGSVPEGLAQRQRPAGPPVVEHEPEHRVIDLRGAEEREAEPARVPLFAHNPVVEHEREPVPTREPAPVRMPLFGSIGGTAQEQVARPEPDPVVVTRAAAPVADVSETRSPSTDVPAAAVAHHHVSDHDASHHDVSHHDLADHDGREGDEVVDPDAPLPEGWHPDPAGHAELRYWDGHRWTAHISTGGRLWLSPLDATRPRTRPTTD